MRNMVIYNDSYAMLFDILSLLTSDCQIKLVSLYSCLYIIKGRTQAEGWLCIGPDKAS